MADEDWKSKFATGLIENVPVLMILLGAILVLLGLTTGIHGWIAIELPWARWVAVVLGVLLIVMASIASPYAKRLPDAESLKVKIQYPAQGSEVDNIVMGGNISKTKLPKDYELRVVKHYSKAWAPIGVVRVNKDGSWESNRCSIGGAAGEFVRISVCLIGPAGKVLISYYDEATSVHEAAMKNVVDTLPPGVARFLPPIREFPPDIIECASTQYKRDNT
jgi:hypothetical protein